MKYYKVWRLSRPEQVGEYITILASSPQAALNKARRIDRVQFVRCYSEGEVFEGWEVHADGPGKGRGLLLEEPLENPKTATPEEQYIAEGCKTCPDCGYIHIHDEPIKMADGCASRRRGCAGCGASWEEEYKITGIIWYHQPSTVNEEKVG